MKHQQQPNRATCFITSLAILWGEDVNYLISLVGHAGTEVLWPELRVPYCYRGHNLDEAMWLSVTLAMPLRLLNRISMVGHDDGDIKQVSSPYNWDELVQRPIPKILGNAGHTIVYDGKYVYDPSRYGISELSIKSSVWEIVLL